MFLSDLHIPYHDKRAVKVAMQFIEHLQPSHIFLGGDVFDFYALSRFDKDPRRILQLQDELDEGDAFFQKLREVCPEAKVTFIAGNHEDRLRKWLWRHPELSQLDALQPEKLFGLEKHRIVWEPKMLQFHGFVLTHGSIVRKYAGYTAKAEYEKFGTSGISGHTHRVGSYRRTNMLGDFVWYEGGCLCRMDPEYIDGKPDWHQAVNVGTFVEGDKRFQFKQYHIVQHKLLHGNTVFSA